MLLQALSKHVLAARQLQVLRTSMMFISSQAVLYAAIGAQPPKP